MCKVLNARKVGKHSNAARVYIGRPSKWGNSFVIGRDGTRADVVAKYRAWIATQPDLMGALEELRGRDLVCWCAPLACHGTLVDLANRRCQALRSSASKRSRMSSSFIAAAAIASAIVG